MPEPTGVSVCTTRSNGIAAWAIASTTGPGHPLWPFGRRLNRVPSHVLIKVYYDDGQSVYYEAREFTDEGWKGPLPFNDVRAWLREDYRRWLKEYDLTRWIDPDAAREVVIRCKSKLGIWRYAGRQNWRLWLQRRLCGRVPADPSRVNCSEAAVRILNGIPEQGEHPLLPRGWNSKPPDEMTPHDVGVDLRRLLSTL